MKAMLTMQGFGQALKERSDEVISDFTLVNSDLL